MSRWTILIAAMLIAFGCGKKQQDEKQETTQQTLTQEPKPTTPAEPIQQGEPLVIRHGQLTNLTRMVHAHHLSGAYQRKIHGKGITIAVLDNGFLGLSDSLGKRLPPDVKVEPAPKNPEQPTMHGTKMAEIAYAIATGSASYNAAKQGPSLLLYNTNGFTNLKAAIDDVIAKNVDIVLYSQVWEYGGNMNGRGFINKEVNRATAAGILWINAAGNYGNAVYHEFIQVQPDQSLRLPYQGSYLRVEVEEDFTEVKFVLSWHDFLETIDYRTPLDLDFEVLNSKMEVVAKSELIQDGKFHDGMKGYTDHAREIVRATLSKGTHYVKIKTKNPSISPQARFHFSASGYKVSLPEAINDLVFVPADNPSVLTVGAIDTDVSNFRPGTGFTAEKPEVYAVSRSIFSDGMDVTGTSTAAAVIAGISAMVFEERGRLDKETLVREIMAGDLGKLVSQHQQLEFCQSTGISLEKCPYRPQTPKFLMQMP